MEWSCVGSEPEVAAVSLSFFSCCDFQCGCWTVSFNGNNTRDDLATHLKFCLLLSLSLAVGTSFMRSTVWVIVAVGHWILPVARAASRQMTSILIISELINGGITTIMLEDKDLHLLWWRLESSDLRIRVLGYIDSSWRWAR